MLVTSLRDTQLQRYANMKTLSIIIYIYDIYMCMCVVNTITIYNTSVMQDWIIFRMSSNLCINVCDRYMQYIN